MRWELAPSAAEFSSHWNLAAGLALGASKIVDIGYQSFDIGLHGTLGVVADQPRPIFAMIEADGRFYPVKLRQVVGIDQRGCGTKTRRWSETTNGAGYLMLRAGYGQIGSGTPTHEAFLLSPGLGYEGNIGDVRRTSLFAQVAWRFDVTVGHAAVPLGGPFVEVGLRL